MLTDTDLLLQGHDAKAGAIIGYLLWKGWHGDRILKNVAMKMYSPNRALARVTYDQEYGQYWLKGEYSSRGENVLAGVSVCVNADASLEETAGVIELFIREAEIRIAQSYAVRILANPPIDQVKISPYSGASWAW